jgi:alpha-N-arabinofuranosidase
MVACLLLANALRAELTYASSSTAPPVDGADIANLAGGGALTGGDDAIWIFGLDRPSQGQTFTTGPNPAGYDLDAVTIQRATGGTTSWSLAGVTGLTYRLRIDTPSGTDLSAADLLNDTTASIAARATTAEGANLVTDPAALGYVTLTGFSVHLNPDTTYSFDVVIPNGISQGWQINANTDTDTNSYTGGTAFSTGDNGTPNDTLVGRGGDRVFHLNLIETTGGGAPVLTGTNPADDATNVPTSANLVASFNKVVQAGTGAISLKRTSDDVEIESFDVSSSSQLSFSGTQLTVNPAANLTAGTGYYVQIDSTAIKDMSNNFFAGIADATSWSFTTALATTGNNVIKLDLSNAGDSDGGSLVDWNQLNNGGTIPAGSVKRHGDGAVVPGATITVSAPATSGFNNDPNSSGWGGTGTDPYYIPAADDLVYTASGPLAITFGGLNDALNYNVRVYSLINENPAPIDINVTNGAGTISRTGLNRSALYNTVPLSSDLIFSGVSTDGSGRIVISIDSTAAVSAEAIVLEARDPALPAARFTASPASGLAPLTVTFTDTSTPGTAGTITHCSWDFGDGGLGNTATAPGATVSHTYNNSGIYQATLTVTTAAGGSDTASQTINSVGTPLVQIDPATPGAVISPLLFGHNLEVTRRSVWSSLGAEMVANRKFVATASGMPKQWTAIASGGGTVASDSTVAYAGAWSVRVNVNTAGQACGIRQQQSQLAFTQGTAYAFRVWLKSDLQRDVWMRLADSTGTTVLGQAQAAIAPGGWQLLSGTFTASASASNARLEIGSETAGAFWIGTVSVLPADNFHGMRRDVIELLKQIKPGALRFPGGCYAEFYEWQDGLLPVDQRPPIGPTGLWFLLPNTDDFDTHEIGTDEFIALCREIGCEPSITIRMSEKTAASAAAWVEYCNGSAATTQGAIRAGRGHSQPYAVKTWFLGNELYGFGRGGMNNASTCAVATKAFAEAVKAVDPSVNLVGCLNGSGSWTNTLIAQAGNLMSHGSYHNYFGNTDLQTASKGATQTIRPALQSVHAAYGRPVTFDEWNTDWGQTGSMSMGFYAAGVINLLCRESASLGVEQAYFFQPVTEGAIKVTPLTAELDTAGKVFAAMSVHSGNRLLPLPATAAAADIDACASLRDDGHIFVTVINRSTTQTNGIALFLPNTLISSATAKLLVAHTANASETVFDEQAVPLTAAGNSVPVSLPRSSIAVVEIVTTTTYAQWAASQGLTGTAGSTTDPAFNADPDHDGQSNQEEFAFGLDPTTGSSVNPITRQLAGGVFKYTRTKDSGLTYKVYYSTNLSAWTLDAAATQSPAAAVGGVETVTVTLAAAAPSDGKLFVRVEATPTP